MRYLLPSLLLGFLLFFLWQGLNKNPTQIPSPLINKLVPQFVKPSLENSQKMLTNKLFLNHLSLLVVWSSWCSSCVTEQAFLLNLAKKSQLQIIGLNYRDTLSAGKRWLKQFGNPYSQIIFDEKGLLGIDLGVYGVPESFLIGTKGIIRYKHIGPLSEAIWNNEVKPLLSRCRKVHG